MPLLSPGAYDSIRQSHEESWEAERRADASTRTVPSPVSASAATRHRTEQLLGSQRDDFNRQNAASRRALMDLAARARALSLHPLNEKVGRGEGTRGEMKPRAAPSPHCLSGLRCGRRRALCREPLRGSWVPGRRRGTALRGSELRWGCVHG